MIHILLSAQEPFNANLDMSDRSQSQVRKSLLVA